MLQALSIFMACWEQENYMIRSLVVKSKEVVYIILLDGHCKLSYVRSESQSTKKTLQMFADRTTNIMSQR